MTVLEAKKKKRQYDNDYPSVTQVLDVLRKIGLEMWFKYNSIEFINAESKKGKEIGTTLHEAIQSNIENTTGEISTQYPDEVTTALKSFFLFKKEHPEIQLLKSEMLLTSEIHKFNGTMDVRGIISGEHVAGDWKTGKCGEKDLPPIYPEYVYQCSAYVHLYNETAEEKIKRAFIVALAKDKVAYNLRMIEEAQISESFSEVFLPALKILKYTKRK